MKSISVLVPTLNCGPILRESLESVVGQEYEGDVEIIAADGGSTDGTVEILQEYGARVVKERKGSPEAAHAIALAEAKNDLVIICDSDNIWPNKNWLGGLARILEKEKGVLAVYPRRYAFRKGESLMNRYFALFGANDPVAWFLGRADRQSYISDKW